MTHGTTWRISAKNTIAKGTIAALALVAAGGLVGGLGDSHETAAPIEDRGDRTEVRIKRSDRIQTKKDILNPNPFPPHATWS